MKILILSLFISFQVFAQSEMLLLFSGGYKNPETTLYLAQQTVTSAQAIRIDNFITMLKDSLGITTLSSKFDVMYLFANESDALSKRNLVVRLYDCTEAGTVNFTQWEGQKSNGINGYLNTNYKPLSNATNYAQNSGAVAICSRTELNTNSNDFGAIDGNNKSISSVIRASSGNGTYFRVNSATSSNTGGDVPTSIGYFVFTRTNATQQNHYTNGALTRTYAVNSNELVDLDVYISASNNNGVAAGFTTRSYSYFSLSAGLSATDVRKLSNCVEAYLDGISKGIIP